MYLFLFDTLEFNLNSYQSLLKGNIIWDLGFPLIMYRNRDRRSILNIEPSLVSGGACILVQHSVHLSLNNVNSSFRSEHYNRF